LTTESAYRTTKLVFAQLCLAVAVLGSWEYCSALKVIDPFFFSRPTYIAARLTHWIVTGSVWRHLAATLIETLLSFFIGAFLGIVLGFVLAVVPSAARLLDPYIRIANALPRVVLAPIFLLWFGLGIWSKVALGVTVVFFVIFFNTFRGVREVDPILIDNARMLGASKGQLARHVLMPSALSWVFSSLHISVGMAIVAVVVGEYLGASTGVGYLIAQAEGVFDTTGMFAGTALLAIVVLTIGAIVSWAEHKLVRWKAAPDSASTEPLP
jgi:NitT/TauT family transport system permease protein